MKNLRQIIVLCATAGCALLAGCSNKNKETGDRTAATPTPVAATGSAASATAGTPVDLKVKWSVGKKYKFRLDQTQDSEGTVPGLPEPIKTATRSGVDYSVTALKEIPGGGWELELEFLAQQVESKAGPTTTLSFDSASTEPDTANPAAKALRKVIGARLKGQADANGKVQRMEGVSDFYAKVAQGGDAQTMMTVKGIFSEATLRDMCSIGEPLPDHAVMPGDTWTGGQQIDAGPLGKLALNLNYTFRGWDRHNDHKCVVLDYTGDISNNSGNTAANGVTAKLENGKLSGHAWFDPEQGMLVDNAGDSSMVLKIKVMGQELNSKVTGTSAMKLVQPGN